ncbi:MAG TPA: polysaccharide biosynthesis/export family protein [Longimicrobium sp.]|nr:polysaccharide biosynthesis/export family protein [Longimicrobium sp.]
MRILLLVFALLLLPAQNVQAQTAETQVLTLSPGDIVRVQIYQEDDISGDYPVDEDGTIVLPLIGTKRVTGIPLRQLRDTLVANFQVHLRNPAITITPLRRVHVLGEVRNPGLFLIDPTVTLAGAIALAGGATSNGDMGRVRIIRENQVLRDRVGVAQTLDAAQVRSNDQILVDRRSWFDRNSTFVVSSLLSATSIIIALIQLRGQQQQDP